MLSKSRGQILRVSATFHVLFHLEIPQPISHAISNEVLEAALDFIEVCCQDASFMAGKGSIEDSVQAIQDSPGPT